MKQPDMFDSPLLGNPKSHRNMLTMPLFDLTRDGKRTDPIVYIEGDKMVEVFPGPKGMMTHFDKDLLIYIVSILVEKLNKGIEPSPVVRFTGYDMMRVAGWDISGKGYKRFENALLRAQSTTIKTNVEMGGHGTDGIFSWLSDAEIVYDRKAGKKRMMYAEVRLCEWLYRGVLSKEMTLTYNKKYFDLKSPIHKRLYEIARAFCGNQDIWQIGIEKLQKRVGSDQLLRHFKAALQKVEEEGSLPEYNLRLINNPTSEMTKNLIDDGVLTGRKPKNKNIVVCFYRK